MEIYAGSPEGEIKKPPTAVSNAGGVKEVPNVFGFTAGL